MTLGAPITLFSVVPPTFTPVPQGMGSTGPCWWGCGGVEAGASVPTRSSVGRDFSDFSVDRVVDGGEPGFRIVDLTRAINSMLNRCSTQSHPGLSRWPS